MGNKDKNVDQQTLVLGILLAQQPLWFDWDPGAQAVLAGRRKPGWVRPLKMAGIMDLHATSCPANMVEVLTHSRHSMPYGS